MQVSREQYQRREGKIREDAQGRSATPHAPGNLRAFRRKEQSFVWISLRHGHAVNLSTQRRADGLDGLYAIGGAIVVQRPGQVVVVHAVYVAIIVPDGLYSPFALCMTEKRDSVYYNVERGYIFEKHSREGQRQ